jgi:uncharacterized membrane protein
LQKNAAAVYAAAAFLDSALVLILVRILLVVLVGILVAVLIVILAVLVLVLIVHRHFLRFFYMRPNRYHSMPKFLGFIPGFK